MCSPALASAGQGKAIKAIQGQVVPALWATVNGPDGGVHLTIPRNNVVVVDVDSPVQSGLAFMVEANRRLRQ